MLGCHVHKENESIAKDIQSAIYDSDVYSLPMTIAAIFVSNPRRLQISLKDENKVKLKEFIKCKKINIIAHSSYVAALWGKTQLIRNNSLKFVLKEYKTCKNVGISGLVVHLPKEKMLKKEKDVIKKLIDGVSHINAASTDAASTDAASTDAASTDAASTDANTTTPTIYLETPAIISMWANYDTGQKLSNLFHIINSIQIKLQKSHPFGLCIDTAHIWTSGNDISTYEGANRWFSELMDMPYIPYDKLIIHLNDSERDLGCGPDKHASLTKGKIWGAYKTREELKKSGLFFILEFAKEHNIPIILERNNKEMLKDDYAILKKLFTGLQ
jgi:endonuclease IV